MVELVHPKGEIEKKQVASGSYDDPSSSSNGKRKTHAEQEIDRLVGIVKAGAQGVHDLLPSKVQSHAHYLVDVGLRDPQIRR